MAEDMYRPAVVVVDDEPILQEIIQEALVDAGFHVILASSYAEALAVIKKTSDKLMGLVTDINLRSDKSAWDIATKARELVPTLPVVYVTGNSAHEWPAHGVPQSLVVTKPFAPVQVVVALAGLANIQDAKRLPDRS